MNLFRVDKFARSKLKNHKNGYESVIFSVKYVFKMKRKAGEKTPISKCEQKVRERPCIQVKHKLPKFSSEMRKIEHSN